MPVVADSTSRLWAPSKLAVSSTPFKPPNSHPVSAALAVAHARKAQSDPCRPYCCYQVHACVHTYVIRSYFHAFIRSVGHSAIHSFRLSFLHSMIL